MAVEDEAEVRAGDSERAGCCGDGEIACFFGGGCSGPSGFDEPGEDGGMGRSGDGFADGGAEVHAAMVCCCLRAL